MSSEIQIEPYDPDDSGRELNNELHDLVKDVFEFEQPGRPEIPLETALLYLRSAPLGGTTSQWIARQGDLVVGRISVGFPTAENSDMITVDANVRVSERRLGIGTALLRAAIERIVSSDRKIVTALGLGDEGPAASWAANLGCRVVRRDVLLRLDVPSIDRTVWNVPTPDGFHIERWVSRTPERYLESFAVARTAIYDAPVADSSTARPVWTPERVREEEASLRSDKAEQRVVAVVEESTDKVIGFTEIHIKQQQPDFGYQMDTAVLTEYRGRSLGFAMKANMLTWLIKERPQVVKVATSTFAENTAVIKMNHRLGFETVRSMVSVEISVPDLRDRL